MVVRLVELMVGFGVSLWVLSFGGCEIGVSVIVVFITWCLMFVGCAFARGLLCLGGCVFCVFDWVGGLDWLIDSVGFAVLVWFDCWVDLF